MYDIIFLTDNWMLRSPLVTYIPYSDFTLVKILDTLSTKNLFDII